MNRWKTWTLCLIGFIDLMLGAGLYLIYSNVRRELHLSRLKSDFVANVSHELKTPLALIRLFAETLEMGRVPGEEKAQQYYRVINKESQRLTQLINNILDFSRIEAGRKEYRLAPADVARIVSEVVEAYRFQIEQQGFTLEVEVEDDLPRVVADKEALAAGPPEPREQRAQVHPRREVPAARRWRAAGTTRCTVSVTDRGIGVAKGEQEKIFEKFYRAEDSLVHETKGSGLGLSLVQAHHGGARRLGRGGERARQGQHVHAGAAVRGGRPRAAARDGSGRGARHVVAAASVRGRAAVVGKAHGAARRAAARKRTSAGRRS